MESPKFSVIIPVYNVTPYLRQCVESLTKTDFDSYEVILIDDGSTDGSAELCDKLQQEYSDRIKVIHKENAGVSIARNAGLEICKGKYVTFVDSDDWVAENYWDVLNRECEKADIVFFGMRKIHESGFVVTYQASEFYSESVEEIEKECQHLIDNDTFCSLYGFTWNKLLRGDIIKEHNIRFIAGQFHYEDELFANEYMRYATSMKVISDVIYNYLWKAGGLTFSRKPTQQYTTMADSLIDASGNAKTAGFKDFLRVRSWNMIFEYFLNSKGFKSKWKASKILKEYSQKAGVKYPRLSVLKSLVQEIIRRK